MENVTGGPAIRVGGFFTLVGFILFFFGSILVMAVIGSGDNPLGVIMGLGMLSLLIGIAAVLAGCGRMSTDVDEAARLLRRLADPRKEGSTEREPAYGVAHGVAAPGDPGDEAESVTS
ncbi:hypothetical protein [Buchananella hordeovulneris]|uniref:hypothetical protein n=1 Tax=Buchananella hordeovulneris TaxID=52770 RepID=UPI0026DD1BA5|nr:hypothetical protein [Buchananella hordeovulneris]MDO5080328.1 hypothetical protein [Buchananella hordeovulneris]